jgi:hypothetical protein
MPHVIAVLALLCCGGPPDNEVGTGPEPAAMPVSWEFEFKFLDPQRIEVRLPDTGESEVYWYMVYTVTNRGDRSQMFFPMFQVVTENLKVFDSDTGISKLVFETIKERHKQTHPYLVHPTKAIGDLLAGADNARESVAIWRQIDLNLDKFTVYVAGLSGEARFVRNPAFDPSKPETTGHGSEGKPAAGNPKYFTLRKTLEIRYNLPGSAAARPLAEPERRVMRWVMR